MKHSVTETGINGGGFKKKLLKMAHFCYMCLLC